MRLRNPYGALLKARGFFVVGRKRASRRREGPWGVALNFVLFP
jgi:hypothetical protein